MSKLPVLRIGRLAIDPPFILGGMGVRSTDHSLVSAVANCGMAGTIAAVALIPEHCRVRDYVQESNAGLAEEIRLSRKLTSGVVGVNIMVAATNYDSLVRTAVSEKVDYIISGAGLPLALPSLAKDSGACLIPIVSSARAAEIICKRWWNKDGYLPDAIVVEGAMAGGHLGFSLDEVSAWGERSLESVCAQVITVAQRYGDMAGRHIPVVAAGGVYDGTDIARLFRIGVEGVQMATRFLATDECSMHANCKQLIVDSEEKDMSILRSPVGMPGRAVMNDLVGRITRGEKTPFSCPYHCLKTCNPATAPFCIAAALIGAHKGDAKNGLIMAGRNAYRIHEIVPVRKLVDDLVAETLAALELAPTK
jgi:nitronate monooxygenase